MNIPQIKLWLPHDNVIKWQHFLSYWPFVWGIHRWPVNSPHKGQWHRALMISLICVWINSWVNNGEAGDLKCHHANYDITVMNLLYMLAPNSNIIVPTNNQDDVIENGQQYLKACWLLTHKQLKMYGCILSYVATDALGPGHHYLQHFK